LPPATSLATLWPIPSETPNSSGASPDRPALPASAEGSECDKKPKAQIQIRNAAGERIRSFEQNVPLGLGRSATPPHGSGSRRKRRRGPPHRRAQRTRLAERISRTKSDIKSILDHVKRRDDERQRKEGTTEKSTELKALEKSARDLRQKLEAVERKL
jgi:hypothetical protein